MYTITLRKRAAKEYLEAIAWYKERSLPAAENFVKEVNEAFIKIESEPAAYKNIYKHFYEIKLRKYPYAIVYFIDEGDSRIVISTIFHYKRNPKKKFDK
jgi:plasmid stabilization system protein ParE